VCPVDDLEAQRDPLDRVQGREGVAAHRWRGLHSEHDLGLDLRRDERSDWQVGHVTIRVPDGVVVHVCPDQRLELEDAPRGLVGEADLQADHAVPGRRTRAYRRGFDGVSGREVQAAGPGGRRCHHLPCAVGLQQFR
jgi:hypothetical protein